MSRLFEHKEPWIWLAGLIMFLSVYAVVTIWIVNKKQNTNQLISIYMVLKVVRLLVFIGILLAYQLAVKIETIRFVLVAIVLYIIYLLLDTLFLTYKEKKWKKG